MFVCMYVCMCVLLKPSCQSSLSSHQIQWEDQITGWKFCQARAVHDTLKVYPGANQKKLKKIAVGKENESWNCQHPKSLQVQGAILDEEPYDVDTARGRAFAKSQSCYKVWFGLNGCQYTPTRQRGGGGGRGLHLKPPKFDDIL